MSLDLDIDLDLGLDLDLDLAARQPAGSQAARQPAGGHSQPTSKQPASQPSEQSGRQKPAARGPNSQSITLGSSWQATSHPAGQPEGRQAGSKANRQSAACGMPPSLPQTGSQPGQSQPGSQTERASLERWPASSHGSQTGGQAVTGNDPFRLAQRPWQSDTGSRASRVEPQPFRGHPIKLERYRE